MMVVGVVVCGMRLMVVLLSCLGVCPPDLLLFLGLFLVLLWDLSMRFLRF